MKFKIIEKKNEILKFTYRCMVCKKSFNLKIKHKEHLKKHTKSELINSLKESGFYNYE